MQDGPTLSDADFRAADEVLARLKTVPPPEDPAYAKLRKAYASLHAAFGPDKFALRVGLREPRSPQEELEVLLFSDQITQEECNKRLKEYATRPVDRPMLQQFFNAFEAALTEYGGVLQLIVEIATDQHDPDAWQHRESEVDSAMAKFDAKYDLFSTELKSVLEFLTQIQADRHEPIRCGDYTGESAHWIAMRVFSDASQAWKHCKEIGDRSMTDPHYLYSMNASALFFKTWIEPKKLPRPNDLAAWMRSEQAKAIARFDANQSPPVAGNLAKTVQPVHFEDFSGHQSSGWYLRTTFELKNGEHWNGTAKVAAILAATSGERGSPAGRSAFNASIGRRQPRQRSHAIWTKSFEQAAESLTQFLSSAQSGVSAKLRDKVKVHAQKRGVAQFDIWSGHEFEERLRRDAESLLKRFIGGEAFPDDPNKLRRFIGNP